jgi:hypothetical protein
MSEHWDTLPRDEKVKAVARLADQGLTSNQIAAQFSGVSRSAIIGFARRAKIVLQSPQAEAARAAIVRGHRKEYARIPAARPAKRAARPHQQRTDLPPRPLPQWVTPDLTHAVPFEDALSNRCTWPLWDAFEGPSVSLCCGAPRDHGQYCRHHVRLSTRTNQNAGEI